MLIEEIELGAIILRQFVSDSETDQIIILLKEIFKISPLRFMIVPNGFKMSVSMTNCGDYGWVSDKNGYKYNTNDPLTSKPWPLMPELFLKIATDAAKELGYNDFFPDACLINCYKPGAKMSLHQDKDEKDFSKPIVSVSLGMSATFLFGGSNRKDKVKKIELNHGDVFVWGGPTRLYYHGVESLKDNYHNKFGNCRINLTFRKAV